MTIRSIDAWIVVWLTTVSFLAAGPASVLAAPQAEHAAEVDQASELGVGEAEGADEHASAASAGEPGPAGRTAGGSPNPLIVDPDLMLYTMLVFLLLLAVLGKFAWRPIIEAVDRREKTVADQLAAAKAAQQQAAKLLEEHQHQLSGAADEVKQLLEQARREADLHKQQVLADAQAAAASEKKRAIGEITAAKNSALRELAERSVDSAIGLAGKIVGRQLQPNDHAELVQETLRDFPSRN